MEYNEDRGIANNVPFVIWSSDDLMDGQFLPHTSNDYLNAALKESVINDVKFADSKTAISEIDQRNTSSRTIYSRSRITKKPKVPDGGWGWVVVFASFVISVIADGISFSFGLLYIEFLNYFGESKSKTSWIGSLFMAVPLLSGPIMSALVDRYGCRSMTILGGLISGLGFVIASFGNSIEWELAFFGVIAGIGLGLCYVTAVVSIAYWFDKYRTLAIGLGACGTGVGTFVYAPLTQFLIEEYGWRGTVLLLAGTLLNMCVCGTLMRDPDWLKEAQSKQVSLRNSSSCYSIRESVADPSAFMQINRDANSIQRISTNLNVKEKWVRNRETSSEESLPSTRSEVNLPTFIHDKEQIHHEAFEHLQSDNAFEFKFFMDNYSSDFTNGTGHDKKVKSDSSKDIISAFKELDRTTNQPPLTDSALDRCKRTGSINQKLSIMKREAFGQNSERCYFKDIRLHRNSLMYRGAMLNISRHRSRASSCPDIFQNSAMTIAKENEEKFFAGSLGLFKTMFDFSMFVEFHFLLMSLATIILFVWLIIPYFYLAEFVTRHGYTEVEASFLLSIIGVTNCFGMVGLGWAGDQPWMNVTKTYAACLTLCGLTCLLMPLTIDKYYGLAALSALFGIFFASNYSFTPSIVVQLISLERFTTAYGLILLCQGIGCLVGPPLAGLIFDLMGDWDFSFYLAGGCIILSAVLVILIQYTENRRLWGSEKLEGERHKNYEV